MYFAYGWPKVAFTDLQPGDTYIHLRATEKFFFAVSRTRVQLWTGGLYRIKLSECMRTEEDVKQEGVHMAALWSPGKATLAILTSENYLHLYAIHTWKDNLVHPSCNISLKDIPKVDIYLKSSIRLDSEFRALSLTGDGHLLLVGFADGTVASLSWSGKMKEVAYPLDDVTDFDGSFAVPGPGEPASPHTLPGTATPPQASPGAPSGAIGGHTSGGGAGGSSAFAAAATTNTFASSSGMGYTLGPVSLANGYSTHSYSGIPGPSQLSRAIVQMSYCEHSKQVVMVLADGACAVCAASEGGLSPLLALCFGRWLCGPAHQAVCAQVGARAQLIAVGRENGEVELYRLHRTAIASAGGPDASFPGAHPGSMPGAGVNVMGPGTAWEPPVRTLTLSSDNWGHKVQQTGPVSQVEWSPDGRAIAVGYAGQGVVVWSPSGCRLMCSLRQPPPGSLSTFPSAASRGVMSHQASLSLRMGQQGSDPSRVFSAVSISSSGSGLPYSAGSGLGPGPLPRPQVPLDSGVSALAWGPSGYQLAVAEVLGATACGAGGGGLLEIMFAHSLSGHHRVARGGLGSSLSDEEVHVLLGHDRLMLIREAGEAAMGVVPWAAGGDGVEPTVGQVGDLTVAHVPVPHSYVAVNWPLQRCAISASGSDIAVAGRSGLAVYNRTLERWRLFGDISQERQVSCRALGWLANGVLVACSGPDPYAPSPVAPPPPAGPLGVAVGGATPAPGGPTGNELLLLPRYHLDLTSLLARHPLQQPPLAMDCLGNHILLASEPLEITLLEVTLHGDLSPTADPRATITTLREISMFDVGRHLSDVALVPLLPVPLSGPPGGGAAAWGASLAPRQCVLLRWGGVLSVLDLEKGAEMTLATEIEAFWLSDAITCQMDGSVGGASTSASGVLETTVAGRTMQGASAMGRQQQQQEDEEASVAAGTSGAGLGGERARPSRHQPAPQQHHGLPGPGPNSVEGGASSSADPGATDSVFAASRATAAAAATVGSAGSASAVPPATGGGSAATTAAATSTAATLDVEMPWWLFGPAGMQLCFPSSLGTVPLGGGREGHDIELEFDQEVYPVGISLADDAIVGITQRLTRNPGGLAMGGGDLQTSAAQMPCFHAIPESQPVLPCLLRRLLQRGAFQEAASLARRHARGPHFARSLEWLLFTALEIETSSLVRPAAAAAKRTSTTADGSETGPPAAAQSQGSQSQLQTTKDAPRQPQQSLLASAADLVRHFPTLFAEVVVSVARKTDAALWPPLFDAVGSPSRLLDGLVEAGELASAACFLLIIDRLEGAAAAQAQALRLMRISLQVGQYALCCELLRFVVPPADQEHDGRGLGSELSFGDDIASPQAAPVGKGPDACAAHQPRPQPQQPASASAQQRTEEASQENKGSGQEQQQQEGQQQQGQQGGRSWLGWLLGYGAESPPADQAAEEQQQTGQQHQQDQQQKQPEQPQPQSQPHAEVALAMAADAEGAPPAAAPSLVQQTLALLGGGGGGGGGGGVRSGSRDGAATTGWGAALPASPARVLSGSAGMAPSSPALAQLLLATASASGGGGAGSAAAAKAACKLVAEHAWRLLEAGHIAALGQLLQASSFLPCGLAGLMNLHRESPYAARGCAMFSALELLSALAVAVSELPVWNGEQVEMVARAVAALCHQVGAAAWAVAMSVLLADGPAVWAFRQQQPEVWAKFVQMLHADATFSYLWGAIDVLSQDADPSGDVPAGALWSGGDGEQQEQGQVGEAEAVGPSSESGAVELVGVPAAAVEGVFAAGSPTASAGHVEFRTISVGRAESEIEDGSQQGGAPLASIPGPRASEVSIARG